MNIFFGTNDKNTVRESDQETKIEKQIGNIDYRVLSPAEYVSEEIDEEDPDSRYRRIHEYCTVIKFEYGGIKRSILIPGDADKTAWKEHITEYHSGKLSCDVLSAVHHGSRTFFKDSEDDNGVFEDHISQIDPSYLVISAPTQKESPHDHPHDDALELYNKYLNDNGILHLGENRESVIVDIYPDGRFDIYTDTDLVDNYQFDEEGGDDSGSQIAVGGATANIDEKSMGID